METDSRKQTLELIASLVATTRGDAQMTIINTALKNGYQWNEWSPLVEKYQTEEKE